MPVVAASRHSDASGSSATCLRLIGLGSRMRHDRAVRMSPAHRGRGVPLAHCGQVVMMDHGLGPESPSHHSYMVDCSVPKLSKSARTVAG